MKTFRIRIAALATFSIVVAVFLVSSAMGGGVEPDDFADETLLNAATPGVILSRTMMSSPNVYARDVTKDNSPAGYGYASTGIHVFARDGAHGGYLWSDASGGTQMLRVDFTIPAIEVSIDAASSDAYDEAKLEAYDAANQLIDADWVVLDQGAGQSLTLSVSSATADIAYVLASGTGVSPSHGGWPNAVCLDNLTYVTDITPPEVACMVDADSLWPPNHKMVEVNVLVDACDDLSAPDTLLLEGVFVSSNEPDDSIADGDTAGDVNGEDGFLALPPGVDVTASFDPGITDENGMQVFFGTLELRAERAGTGEDRIYTITCLVSDEAGNIGIASCEVVVPHDRRGGGGNKK